MRWRESERESIVIKEFTYASPPPPHRSIPSHSPTLSVPHFPRLPFAIATDISRKYFYILSVTFGSKVLPIFRNYNSLLPRTRKRGNTVETSENTRSEYKSSLLYIYIYMCTCVHVCICIHICMYIHIHVYERAKRVCKWLH